jgi:hypothetical protein
MTAKEKAVDLFNDYYSYLKANLMYDEEARLDAKVCALMAVDELIYETQFEVPNIRQRYWIDVKQEIEKL